MTEDSVQAGTGGLIRGALVVAAILIILFAGMFLVSRFSGGGEGKTAASYTVHTSQLT
jgi:hypothetical protein